MPAATSRRECLSSCLVLPMRSVSLRRPREMSSSTSSFDCQLYRYADRVVPTMATSMDKECAGKNGKKKPARIMLANDGEEAFPRNLAHLRTEIHGGIHHGQERWDGPQERRPERGADRGVSSDRGGIVVGGPGNQPQAEGA